MTLRTEPVRRGLEALARSGLEWTAFSRGALELLAAAVPFEAGCMGPADPATGLLTGSAKVHLPDTRDLEFFQHEYLLDEVNLFTDLARRPSHVGVLADDAGGDPARSSRHRDYFVPYYGLRHEMRAAAVADGRMWGHLALYRTDRPSGFSPAEADFLARVVPSLAHGLRAGLVADVARAAGTPAGAVADGPAVLVVDPSDGVAQVTASAEARIEELGGSAWGVLPTPVGAIVAAARRAGRDDGGGLPRLRVRAPSGRWLVVHASPLAARDGVGRQVVVTIEDARPAEVVPLVLAALGLTARERSVVAAVLAGAGTREIAARLHLSPWTVQDHLKSVFEKAGVGSRRELVARVFFDRHAAPPAADAESAVDAHSAAWPA
ncbi:helix-turn-helix transcriptional regulator [Actinotalea fermentans]|uniref:helix-turn-helix transcriptional regulator n=1 Tax=Actinotalea fermentans TaxID=43671 RepID=UPI000689CDE2|nr:helix-turn-helix transcriptional regulator [Actinotalea fermentans]